MSIFQAAQINKVALMKSDNKPLAILAKGTIIWVRRWISYTWHQERVMVISDTSALNLDEWVFTTNNIYECTKI